MCATPRFSLRAEAGFLFAYLQFAKERLLLEANQIVGLQYSASSTHIGMTGIPRKFQRAAKIAVQTFRKNTQSEPVNTDTEGVIENVRINGAVSIKRVEFRENERAFFPQGQSKLSIIVYRGDTEAIFLGHLQ